MKDQILSEEPPTGSVVAIDWGGPRQEVWVANKSNIGNWYTTDIPLDGRYHPTWYDVQCRAEGRSMVLLVVGDDDMYRAGFDAGVSKTAAEVAETLDKVRYSVRR